MFLTFHHALQIIIVFFAVTFAVSAVAEQPAGNRAYTSGDYERAFDIFSTQAEQGNQIAQYNLGMMYRQGKGVAQNYELAATWLAAAAGNGLANAQFELGLFYIQGRGVARDYTMAEFWWQKAAGNGDPRSAHHLGGLYAIGPGSASGLKKDDAIAANWYRRGAEMGYARSQFELGRFYIEGRGVGRDPIVGMMWLMLAENNAAGDLEHLRENISQHRRNLPAVQMQIASRKASDCRKSGYVNCS